MTAKYLTVLLDSFTIIKYWRPWICNQLTRRLHSITIEIELIHIFLNHISQSVPSPKEWSISINRVDNAAYHHDLCYSKHDDTKTRNEVYDKTMPCELSGIVNPTLRERIDKSIVGKLINAKVNFGLGAPMKKKSLKYTDEFAEELYKQSI